MPEFIQSSIQLNLCMKSCDKTKPVLWKGHLLAFSI